MTEKDIERLKLLGATQTVYPTTPHPSVLETFPNPYPESVYVVDFETEEFTSLCPKTGQPDFGRILISYSPEKVCVESKSLKLYLFAYRQTGTFWERLVNRIGRDLVSVLDPFYLRVEGKMVPRGGLTLQVQAVYTREGKWGPLKEER